MRKHEYERRLENEQWRQRLLRIENEEQVRYHEEKERQNNEEFNNRINFFMVFTVFLLLLVFFMAIAIEGAAYKEQRLRNQVNVYAQEFIDCRADLYQAQEEYANSLFDKVSITVSVEKIIEAKTESNGWISNCCYPKECEGLYDNTGCNPQCQYLVYCGE